jgi:hypothetical protein
MTTVVESHISRHHVTHDGLRDHRCGRHRADIQRPPQADYDAWHDHIVNNGFGLDRGNGLHFQPQPAGPRSTSCRPNRRGSPLGTSVPWDFQGMVRRYEQTDRPDS